ncbi:piggyBac transposable element-derived protein 4-like [Vespula squamosa]|uniref:PiggyBac transposable element-derived protein 4-like n=1 Tax=Vespula squamosa TaxID=30214 RepID=A0ABD2A144_VESSQ
MQKVSMEISIDEAVVGYKHRILFITYNPMKLTKWEFRIYLLADSKTGYIYTILSYYEKITSDSLIKPELPVSTRIVLHLYNKLLQELPEAKGYHIFTDRYYISLIFAKKLLKLNAHLAGTINKNRKYVPSHIRKSKF